MLELNAGTGGTGGGWAPPVRGGIFGGGGRGGGTLDDWGATDMLTNCWLSCCGCMTGGGGSGGAAWTAGCVDLLALSNMSSSSAWCADFCWVGSGGKGGGLNGADDTEGGGAAFKFNSCSIGSSYNVNNAFWLP